MKNLGVRSSVISILVNVAARFVFAAFIWWGWNIFARNFNLPQFGYIEIFAMRMALECIVRTLRYKEV